MRFSLKEFGKRCLMREVPCQSPFFVGPEETIIVDMMYAFGLYKIGTLRELKEVSFIELPYQGDTVSMFVLVPKPLHEMSSFAVSTEYRSIKKLTKSLREIPDIASQLLTGGMDTTLELSLPKFTLEFNTELSGILMKFGVVDAFTPGVADFGYMTEGGRSVFEDGVHMSEGYHKAKIVVDEEGTEAAGATAMVISKRSAGIGLRDVFVVDQPFMFMLVHRETQTILFMGQVNDPRKS
eukprot:TRINITY_DN54074_c0_g1_i9.p5 TRINITY_DN54074_c0_g1~~TRINITY_DN54074_c0_g1_i9.p5  ORF type:complete len:238 (-),score=32.17 TRINITY_DN54074_c0_g1_i9:1828-2541(-)